MTLDPRKWTTKTSEAVSAAMQAATVVGHPELTPHHLLAELLKQEGTIVSLLLAKVGVAVNALAEKCANALAKLPTANGALGMRRGSRMPHRVTVRCSVTNSLP